MGGNFIVACSPSSRKEAGSDIVIGPADTTSRCTLCLTLAAGSLANSYTKAAGVARKAGEEVTTSLPCYRVGCSNLEMGASLTLLNDGDIAIDSGQQRIDIFSHIWVVGVEWLRVGGRGYHHGLFLVATARSWVESSEPRMSSSVVTNESDIDVEPAQVALFYFSRSALCFQREHGGPETMSQGSRLV